MSLSWVYLFTRGHEVTKGLSKKILISPFLIRGFVPSCESLNGCFIFLHSSLHPVLLFDEEEADRNVCSTVPFLGHRIHHALERLDTSLGNEPLFGKRLQIRRRKQG